MNLVGEVLVARVSAPDLRTEYTRKAIANLAHRVRDGMRPTREAIAHGKQESTPIERRKRGCIFLQPTEKRDSLRRPPPFRIALRSPGRTQAVLRRVSIEHAARMPTRATFDHPHHPRLDQSLNLPSFHAGWSAPCFSRLE